MLLIQNQSSGARTTLLEKKKKLFTPKLFPLEDELINYHIP